MYAYIKVLNHDCLTENPRRENAAPRGKNEDIGLEVKWNDTWFKSSCTKLWENTHCKNSLQNPCRNVGQIIMFSDIVCFQRICKYGNPFANPFKVDDSSKLEYGANTGIWSTTHLLKQIRLTSERLWNIQVFWNNF